LFFETGAHEDFDEIVFACHAPDAFALLEDADETEAGILTPVSALSRTVSSFTVTKP
jgi:predicted NAD/FAD-binding protein